MQRSDVQVTTPDGTCPAVVVTPDGDGPWPAVILYMDAGGLRPAIVEMAERLASMGYVVLAPEMYYRHGPYEPFQLSTLFTAPDQRERLFGMVSSVTVANAARDTGAFLDFLAAHPAVAGTKVGTTGYCMGGWVSLGVASHHPGRIAATASFHGGNLANDAPD